MGWAVKSGARADLGWLPMILRTDDKRKLREQLQERYAHGGGYSPFPNKDEFSLEIHRLRPGRATLTWKEKDPDPTEADYCEVFTERARCFFPETQELAILFDSAVLVIVDASDNFEIVRVD